MQKNTSNLVSCDTEKVVVTDAKKFMDKIGLSGICKIIQNKPPSTGGKMVFDNGKEIEIVEATTALQKSFIVIEVYNVGGLCLSFLNTPINRGAPNGPVFFNISGIGFAVKQIPEQDTIEFEFEDKKYTASIEAFHEKQVQLPDGRVLRITQSTSPPIKPTKFNVLKFAQASLVPEKINEENPKTHIFDRSKD